MISVWKFGALLWAKDVVINILSLAQSLFFLFLLVQLCVESEFQKKENKV